jgi:predicted CoA-substrate-specific enzyme activase
MYFVGCDLGSTTGKVVILDENKKILGWAIIRSTKGPQKTYETALDLAMQNAGLTMSRDEFVSQAKIVTTGYGRSNVEGLDDDVSEISCHAKGATYMHPQTRTIIDIGGQDCKVISVDENGRVLDFQMNDKCSAGTGRFFEVMGRVLDLSLEELANEALKSDAPCEISKQCSVFAESEVISLVNSNVPLMDICAGIHESIARRIHGMAFKVGIESDVALTGGCAQNKALRKYLEKRLRLPLAELNENPQLMGALGAALFALEN